MTQIIGGTGEQLTVKQQQGIAQSAGYLNRGAYRKAMIHDKRRTKNTSMLKANAVSAFAIGRITGAPVYMKKRTKLKYYQKKRA